MSSDDRTVVFLRGPRVIMRPVEPSDIPHLTRWINDPEVRIYLQNIVPKNTVAEEAWVSRLEERTDHDIILMIDVDGTPIGNMGLHRIDWVSRTAVTGAIIGEKEYWNKGYGKEAKMLLLYHAFYTLNLRKIRSSVYAFNKRSIAYSLNSGYEQEGILRDQLYRDGRYWDEHMLAIYRNAWEPRWLAFKEEHGITTIE